MSHWIKIPEFPLAQPSYLKSDAPRSHWSTLEWVIERGVREIIWNLSILKPKDILNLGLWVMVLTGVGSALHYNHVIPIAGASSQIKAPSSLQVESSGPEVAVKALPAGPSGQLLPPGTMAPAYTYANSYVRGQCTWYVAGRRQIPGNWGDARTWYPRAQSAGWSVGATPAVAAIAWTPAGARGHVAVVEAIENGQVLISEMNYMGAYKIDKRWAPISAFKYIY